MYFFLEGVKSVYRWYYYRHAQLIPSLNNNVWYYPSLHPKQKGLVLPPHPIKGVYYFTREGFFYEKMVNVPHITY